MNNVLKLASTAIGLLIDALLVGDLIMTIREHLKKQPDSNKPGQENKAYGTC